MIFDPALGQRIALAYDALRTWNYAALYSFRAMAYDEARQFAYARRFIQIEPWEAEGQPYPYSKAMRADVLNKHHLYVFAGGNPHPCRSPEEVFRGRAVHDIFAHAMTGFEFGPNGELNAFRTHARLYSPEALPALACDNLGQTAYYYFHPSNIGKTHNARQWPEQKVDLLPDYLWRGLV